MARVTRRHKIVRILFLIAAALAWMGPPRPPAPPGCWFPRPPRPPVPFQENVDTPSPASRGAAIAAQSSAAADR